jgi:hypothetical protein
MKRIGPCMQAAVSYVRSHPGCAILPVAVAVGPHGSTQYGYKTVHRAISAGLLTYTIHKGRYQLYAAQ